MVDLIGNLKNNRKLRFLSMLLALNIFCLLIDLNAQAAISRYGTSNEYLSNQEKESLDVNKINSSVDAGSFYSVDFSIKQLEENMTKMAQELSKLKQHVEFAKLAEQKRILQIQKLENEVQKLEKENIKFSQHWLNNSLDNSWTGSSSKMEYSDNKSHDVESTTTVTVYQAEPAKTQLAQISTVTQSNPTQIAIAALPVFTQSESTKTATVSSQMTMPQAVAPQPIHQLAHQDVVVQVVEYKNN